MGTTYTLALFAPIESTKHNGTWTANTTLYIMDLDCVDTRANLDLDGYVYESPEGCRIQTDSFIDQTVGVRASLPGNHTQYAPLDQAKVTFRALRWRFLLWSATLGTGV